MMNFWQALDIQRQDFLGDQIANMSADGLVSQTVPYVLLEHAAADLLPVDKSRYLPVPERYFEQEPWLAPQLLPLARTDDSVVLQEALAGAVLNAVERSRSQRIAAVLWGPANPTDVLDHLANLSYQFDPSDELLDGCVFRYQDPRVMQRVWPALTQPQRRAWLGPVRRWYAALQPAGPKPVVPAMPLWFAQPDASVDAPHARLHHLFDAAQWRLAHSAPAENAFWAVVVQETQPQDVRSMPSTGTLRDWLNEAARRDLDSQDQTDWALCCWAAGQDHWDSPLGQQQSQAALALQHTHAGLGFADAWRTVRQSL